MRLLVDTNRYAVIVGNKRENIEYLSQAEEVWLSLITVGELLAGFALGTQREFHEQRLEDVITVQGVGVLRPDLETARIYAQAHRERDVHFQHVPGLPLV